MGEGAVRARILDGDVNVGPIVIAARDLVGVEIPVAKDTVALPSSRGTFVVVGNVKQNPLTRALLDRFRLSDAGTDGSGSWVLREVEDKAAQQRIILVAGVDAEATRKAVGLFGRFLRSEGAWLMEVP